MEIDPELLIRYNRGLCSEQERRAVEDWLEGVHPEDGQDNAEIPAALKHPIGARVWHRLDPARPRRRWRRYYMSLAVAASITLVAALSYFLISSAGAGSSRVQYQAVQTSKGQRINVTLPDGTRVALNSDSELKYPKAFSDTIRSVYLRGEAFFTVTRNAAKPFIVRTDHSEARVLGTVFDLKAYPTEPTTTLVVQEGCVAFSALTPSGKTDTLTANQRIVLHEGLLQARTDVNASRAGAWQQSILVFENLTVAQIAVDLERWYGVTINIPSEALKAQRYTGTFHQATLPAVLKSMAYAINFHYEIQDKTVTLYAHEPH